MLQSQPSRVGSLLLLLAAVIGFAVALYAWLTPLTGVTWLSPAWCWRYLP